jgi:hypothetical protein
MMECAKARGFHGHSQNWLWHPTPSPLVAIDRWSIADIFGYDPVAMAQNHSKMAKFNQARPV